VKLNKRLKQHWRMSPSRWMSFVLTFCLCLQYFVVFNNINLLVVIANDSRGYDSGLMYMWIMVYCGLLSPYIYDHCKAFLLHQLLHGRNASKIWSIMSASCMVRCDKLVEDKISHVQDLSLRAVDVHKAREHTYGTY